MKSICYVHKDIGDIDRGGVCVLFKAIMAGLISRGWKVSCITQREFSMPGINIITLPATKDPVLYSKMVSEAIETLTPDIAECSNWKFELLDYSRRQNRFVKVVVRSDPSATTLFGFDLDNLAQLEKELCLNADIVLAVSGFAKKDIIKKYGIKDVRVIHNSIDTNTLIIPESVHIPKCIARDKINVFWCGKTTLMKGFDLLKALIAESPNDINWILNIGNSIEEVLRDDLKKENVVILNNLARQDQINIWKNCDIFLSTSRVEGFGLALAEALALGLPALVNDNCEVYKEFQTNDAIEYIDPSNVIDTLRKIKKLSKNKVNFDRLNPEFHREHMIDESLKVYESLLK